MLILCFYRNKNLTDNGFINFGKFIKDFPALNSITLAFRW